MRDQLQVLSLMIHIALNTSYAESGKIVDQHSCNSFCNIVLSEGLHTKPLLESSWNGRSRIIRKTRSGKMIQVTLGFLEKNKGTALILSRLAAMYKVVEVFVSKIIRKHKEVLIAGVQGGSLSLN
jgi:hypothetical protein